MEGPPFQLLEAAAQRIITEILQEHPQVSGVQLHLCKPHVAVVGTLDSLGEFLD